MNGNAVSALARLKQLKTLPLLYEECLARLELDGLSDPHKMGETEIRRLHLVLDFFYDRFSLEGKSVF